LLAFASAVAGLLVFATSGTSNADVAPIADFSTYPPALPASCTVSGPDVVVGEQFSSGGTTVADLRDLAPAPGATITMTWTGFAPGCEGVGVGLSSKVAPNTAFDGAASYFLHNFAYCGPEAGATPCAAPFQLSVQVPTAAESPCYQIDAHLAPPLIRVGPNAAYYGVLNGVRNLLISALNAGQAPCEPLTPCASNPDVPASAFECQTSTTAPPPSEPPPTEPPTTAPPTTVTSPGQPPCSVNPQLPADSPNCVACSSNPQVPASSADCTPCAANPQIPASSADCVAVQGTQLAQCEAPLVLDSTTGQCISVISGGALPLTGRDSRSLMLTGALLLLAGLCIAYAYGRERPLA
jgi:hypothetical protein